MNSQDMLDYALGRLEGDARERAEREVAADPALADRVDRLGRAIRRRLDDGLDELAPPEGLAWRTVSRIEERRRPRARTLRDYVPVVVPFRWADVAVAASIFLAGLLTLIPAAYRGKLQRGQLGCVFNLQQLGLALSQYADTNRAFPYTPPDCPAAHAGSFAFLLHDSRLLPDPRALDCPCNGHSEPEAPLPDFRGVCEIRKASPARYARMIGWDYAYHVGFRRGSGRPGPVLPVRSPYVPILADRPAHDGRQRILEGNSPNHLGRGQNVLFTDGHIRWHHTRRLGPRDPDMFLNAQRQPAPGLDEHDATLVPGPFRFDGQSAGIPMPHQP